MELSLAVSSEHRMKLLLKSLLVAYRDEDRDHGRIRFCHNQFAKPK